MDIEYNKKIKKDLYSWAKVVQTGLNGSLNRYAPYWSSETGRINSLSDPTEHVDYGKYKSYRRFEALVDSIFYAGIHAYDEYREWLGDRGYKAEDYGEDVSWSQNFEDVFNISPEDLTYKLISKSVLDNKRSAGNYFIPNKRGKFKEFEDLILLSTLNKWEQEEVYSFHGSTQDWSVRELLTNELDNSGFASFEDMKFHLSFISIVKDPYKGFLKK